MYIQLSYGDLIMKLCRKCNETVPSRVTIDGKTRNLQSRKYCLTCSPFGLHNTRADIDHARQAYRKLPFSEWPEDLKELNRASTWKRGVDRKIKLVEMKGGGCQVCGYNQCHRALSFHHRVSADKKFQLGGVDLRNRKWSDILIEVEKCDLLCNNCHMELHDKESESIYIDILKRHNKI